MSPQHHSQTQRILDLLSQRGLLRPSDLDAIGASRVTLARILSNTLSKLLQSGHEGFACGASAVEERVLKERLLTQALSQLSERERLVLTLYYQHELSLKEIALVLELSDARVCQLSKQAIAKASRYLNERG